MASRPTFWPRPRPQTFGLGLDFSLPTFWPRPRPQTFGLGLASISLSYYVIGQKSAKNRVKFGNFVNFSRNNLKSYVVSHYLVLFHNYFWPRPWRQAPEIGLGLSLCLGLEVLASFNITATYEYSREHRAVKYVR